jgi:hypothetical protein
MRLKKLIKAFEFSEPNRRRITLGPGVRLVANEHKLELVASSGQFSTAADLYAKTRLTSPSTCKQWIGFYVDLTNKKNSTGAVVTAVKYRLSPDGTAQLWWNGSAWMAASAGQWNTEDEVSTHIGAFPGGPIQVILNLSTSDSSLTPEVRSVKLLWTSDVEFQQEYIARSLIPAMREEILPISDYRVGAAAALSTLNLNALETPYNIVGVDSVYNLTTDPTKQINRLTGYNATTKAVTFTACAPGDQLLIRFVYSPEVVIVQSQDFTELAKVPAICIESIMGGDCFTIQPGDVVFSKATGAGWQLKEGFQQDINFTVRIIADKAADLDALSDQVKLFFQDRLLRARGQDEYFRLWTLDEYNHQPNAAQSELHSARLRARISDAVFYLKDAVAVQATQRLLVTGGNLSFSR